MIRLYSKAFTYVYGLEFYDTCQAVLRYRGTSTLKMSFPADADAVHYIEENGWIVYDSPEGDVPFVIRHIQQTDEGVDIIAYSGHALLNQRVTVPGAGDYAIESTGSTDAVVKDFINDSLRGLPLSTAAAQGGITITEQSRYKMLGDEVERVLAGVDRGETYEMDAANARIIFDSYLGDDRSRGNTDGNAPVVFAAKYKNIEQYRYKSDITRIQSTVYVGGAGEGIAREIAIVGGTASGIDRVERFLDARDVDAGNTDLLEERGGQAVIPAQVNAELVALSDSNLVYGVDYFLGDIVTCLVNRRTYQLSGGFYNPVTEEVELDQRITEVCISHVRGGAYYVDLRFDDEPITPTQLQTLKKEVDGLKAVEGGGGVAGPASSTDSHLVAFDGTGGNTLKDSGYGVSDLLLQPIRIPSGSDLDSYTTPGMYYCPLSADAALIANTPVNEAFALLVEKHAGYKQTFTEYHYNEVQVYTRNYYSGTWGSWYRDWNASYAQGQFTGNVTWLGDGLISPQSGGIYFDSYGNVCAKSTVGATNSWNVKGHVGYLFRVPIGTNGGIPKIAGWPEKDYDRQSYTLAANTNLAFSLSEGEHALFSWANEISGGDLKMFVNGDTNTSNYHSYTVRADGSVYSGYNYIGYGGSTSYLTFVHGIIACIDGDIIITTWGMRGESDHRYQDAAIRKAAGSLSSIRFNQTGELTITKLNSIATTI